jgi:hypothetical protein
LYVSGLKKNLLSVAALEDKGYKVAFMDGKVVIWPKDGQLSSTKSLEYEKEVSTKSRIILLMRLLIS